MKEPEKTISELLTSGFFFTIGISLFSGLAGYFKRVSTGSGNSFIALLSQLSAATLTGAISYFIGNKFDIDIEYICVIAAVGGWAGTRTMQFLENFLKNWAIKHVQKEKSVLTIAKETLAQTVDSAHQEKDKKH